MYIHSSCITVVGLLSFAAIISVVQSTIGTFSFLANLIDIVRGSWVLIHASHNERE